MTDVPTKIAEPARDARFWNRMAAGYAKRPVADQASYDRKLEITRTYLKPEMEVLEFGCGTGSTALVHAPFVKHILAFDFSSQMIDIAREKADAQGIGNVTFKIDRIEDFASPSNHYDVVLGLSILHLLQDQRAAITKTYDMLKPGGLFISSTACLRGEMSWFKPILAVGSAVGLLPRVAFFTVNHLETLLREAGFRLESSWKPGPRKGVFIVARKPE
ncbi:class I SAM-dependent methyltransferase [Roseobacter sp. YSTF-M11]|uniref:Class I SAM-dependent methyltransferase n=1 Tax=Roseobacter insulae TaxID=2859783 RepID=A0A9X1FXR8_9RHOB|nr:class I SAM-dependent methyltransferase [Roseobacter insulae]MBW4709247.1 class I SAM-dependent methyltransferase [Roseobacter insulae]